MSIIYLNVSKYITCTKRQTNRNLTSKAFLYHSFHSVISKLANTMTYQAGSQGDNLGDFVQKLLLNKLPRIFLFSLSVLS